MSFVPGGKLAEYGEMETAGFNPNVVEPNIIKYIRQYNAIKKKKEEEKKNENKNV